MSLPYNFFFSLSLILLFSKQSVAQLTMGPLNPGSVSTGSCSFSYSSVIGYAPTISVVSSNNISASVVHCPCCDAHTNCLRATNFGFTIPLGAIITGITVEIEKRADAGSNVQDNGLRLLQGGVEIGSNLANFGFNWPSSDTYFSYGGCNNLWGVSWTPADINNINFGFVFASIDYSCLGNITSFIDHVRVTVCYNLVLPVDLVSFRGNRSHGTDELSWSTSAEMDLDHFLIERSLDAKSFEPIAKLAAFNLSAGANYNHYHINTTDQVAYYRLRMVDNDGSFKFSDVIALGENLKLKQIKIFPNPASESVSIQLSDNNSSDIEVVIFDKLGQELDVIKIPSASSSYSLNTNSLTGGIYYLQVRSQNQIVAGQKLIIKK